MPPNRSEQPPSLKSMINELETSEMVNTEHTVQLKNGLKPVNLESQETIVDDSLNGEPSKSEEGKSEEERRDDKQKGKETEAGVEEQDEVDVNDKEEDDSNDLSEGEDVDNIQEYVRWRHPNYKDIKQRIKMVGKRRAQYHQYINIIEERITVLETMCKALDKRTRKKGQEDDDDDDKKSLKFELNPQLWGDFNKYRAPDSKFHVIDILVEEPEYASEQQAGTKRGMDLSKLLNPETVATTDSDNKERTVDEKKDEIGKLVDDIKGQRLPPSIRFNSMALQHLLRKHFHHGATSIRVFTDTRYQMLRPFKALTHFENEIKGLMEDLLKLIDNLRRTGSTHGESKDEEEGESDEKKEDPKRRESSGGEQSGCPMNPDEPMTITKTQWTQIFKELELYHTEETMKYIVQDWPTDFSVKKTFQCLVEFIDEWVKPVTSRLRDRQVEKVRFAELWHLFRSGDEIVTKQTTKTDDQAMALRVLRINGGRRHIHPSIAPSFDSTRLPEAEDRVQPVNGVNPFAIHAWYLDFDGTHLSPVRKRIVIQPYVGERNITDLEVYPLVYAPNADQLKADLVGRGKRFVNIVRSPTVSYCDCNGEELDTKEELNDKVIVDMKEYDRVYSLPGYTEPDALDMSETSNCTQGLNCTMGPECYHTSAKIIQDQYTEKAAMKKYIDSQPIFQQFSNTSQREKLTLVEDDYALCNFRLFAYKLRSRDWVQVHVSSLAEASMEDDDKGFERLVLPSGHKHIIKSQVKEHFRKKALSTSAAQDDLDLVRGKGQGLIILLHGAPGVGKTCTAETIADLVHKPLYPITCGDLGSTAMEVEKNLKQHFTLASKWDCVMLLDEADVFLAKRKSDDLQRNSIVSVFLRIMEYYKGLLFLTTNRVGTFDEAFKSRVHISLFYSDFDKKTTVKVWKTFINQTEEAVKRKGWSHFEVRAKEIKKFARQHWDENPDARWNGRQIRNAFHTAIAMAEFDAREKREEKGGENVKIVLGRAQFEKIASTVKDFDRYMIETMKGTYEGYADKDRLRAMKKAEEKRMKAKSKKTKKQSSDEETSSSSSSSDDESEEEKAKEKEKDKDKKSKKGKKKDKKAKKEETESESESSDSDSD